MKKIVIIILAVVGVLGCGKKASGTVSISNLSSKTVSYGIGEDYTVRNYTLESHKTVNASWKQYFIFWIESPKNIVMYEQKNNSITIKDAVPSYPVLIHNHTGISIEIADNDRYVLADKRKKYTTSLAIPPGTYQSDFYGYLTDKNFEALKKQAYRVTFKIDIDKIEEDNHTLPRPMQTIEITK